MHTIDRPFQIETDYGRLHALIRESFQRDPKLYNWPPARLDGLRYGHEWRGELAGVHPWMAGAHVWEEAESGRLLGVCHGEEAHQGAIEIHPDARHLEDTLFAWLEEHDRQTRPTDTPPFETWVFAEDSVRKETLLRRGWQPGPPCGVTRIRRMALPIVDAPLAQGFTLRPINEGSVEDWARLADATNAIFAHAQFEADTYRALQQAPTWNTHWVAHAADGRFAAIAGIWHTPETGQAQFEPVGTVAEFRRLGLARAVMTAALRHLLTIGATMVYVDTGYTNDANALYAGLGFTEVDVFECWHKPRAV